MSRYKLVPEVREDLKEIYVILFRAVEDGIEIIQVVHGARDINAIFRSRS